MFYVISLLFSCCRDTGGTICWLISILNRRWVASAGCKTENRLDQRLITAFRSWAFFYHLLSPQPYSISDVLRRDWDPIFSHTAFPPAYFLYLQRLAWGMTAGRRWKIRLLRNRVSFKLPGRLEPASEGHNGPLSDREYLARRRWGSTWECVLEPQLQMGPVASGRWLVELHVMRDEEYSVLAGRWALGSGWRMATGEQSSVSSSEKHPGKVSGRGIVFVLYNMENAAIIVESSGDRLNEEWRCNQGWTAVEGGWWYYSCTVAVLHFHSFSAAELQREAKITYYLRQGGCFCLCLFVWWLVW